MNVRRLARTLALPFTALLLVIGSAAPAHAASDDQKLATLASFTQPSTSSYQDWNNARLHQGDYADYGFDWSTDYCSFSPDEPLGFDFRLPCWRHDFGYRNYKAVAQFPANKDRVDSAFYADLKTKCATYNRFVRPACYSLAWTYYEAVHEFGSLAAVRQTDLDRAATLKADGLAEARAEAVSRAS